MGRNNISRLITLSIINTLKTFALPVESKLDQRIDQGVEDVIGPNSATNPANKFAGVLPPAYQNQDVSQNSENILPTQAAVNLKLPNLAAREVIITTIDPLKNFVNQENMSDLAADAGVKHAETIEDGEVPGVGLRALAVFGFASIFAIVYFYFKLKRIKAREQVQYGILEDSEFELRHLELSDDSEDDDDPTLYTSRKNIRRPNKQY